VRGCRGPGARARALLARGLRTARNFTIGFLLPGVWSPIYDPIVLVQLPLGAAAVDLVLGRVRGEAPSDIMVSGEISLISRESTAPPPGHAS
jgi:DNA-binding LacI/PurR family transcriptional regulator